MYRIVKGVLVLLFILDCGCKEVTEILSSDCHAMSKMNCKKM